MAIASINFKKRGMAFEDSVLKSYKANLKSDPNIEFDVFTREMVGTRRLSRAQVGTLQALSHGFGQGKPLTTDQVMHALEGGRNTALKAVKNIATIAGGLIAAGAAAYGAKIGVVALLASFGGPHVMGAAIGLGIGLLIGVVIAATVMHIRNQAKIKQMMAAEISGEADDIRLMQAPKAEASPREPQAEVINEQPVQPVQNVPARSGLRAPTFIGQMPMVGPVDPSFLPPPVAPSLRRRAQTEPVALPILEEVATPVATPEPSLA